MAGVSQDQIERAKAVPLLDYLLSHEGDNFKRVGNAYYRRDPDHDSLEVSNNLWHWHSRGIGGNIIDYLIKINGYSFVDAVRHLAGDDYSASYTVPKARPIPPKARPPTAPFKPIAAGDPPERNPFNLPPRNRDNERAVTYLESRGIDKNLIRDCIARGSLYESKTYHNCVFIGRDESGKARFAALRGTAGSFKRDADGSDKRFGFCLPPNERDHKTVIVFESPIDALSHKALFPDVDGWRLSLGGTALSALMQFLDVHKEITNITVCTDNDAAGNVCAAKIAEISGVPIIRELPKQGKDWNEFLQITKKEVGNLKDARKDISFINSDYGGLFKIKDGESIKFTSGYDGEVKNLKCRFIDETHTVIGSETYHICQWAEICERNGHTFAPADRRENKIDILAAKYGADLQAAAVPMTEAAIKELVGGDYTVETLYNRDKKYIFGALVRGEDGIAVCGLGGRNSDTLTNLHPYHAQTYKCELSPAMPPQPQKSSLLDELEATQKEVAATNIVKATGEKPRKLAVAEI